MAFRKILVNALISLALVSSTAAHAQDFLSDRLSRERFGVIQPGNYTAGDTIGFAIQNLGSNFLLRFQGAPEIFVLYADRASMGGRILKYDSGETALQVSVWGGVTLYTDAQPGGLPAVREGDAQPLALPAVSMSEIQNDAADGAQHLAYVRHLRIAFSTNWSAIAADAGLRALYCDVMQNAIRGVEQFAASNAAREILSKRVDTVSIVPAPRPTVNMNGRTLLVTFNPATGFVGRASSRAIARGLSKLFAVH
jgi:hypothetical protein